MKNYSFILLCLLLATACNKNKNQHETIAGIDTLKRTNDLTETQAKEGWINLFNGTSLDGWKFFKDKENNSWEVVDGTLHCKPFGEGAENKRSDLMTIDQYENFEITFDWKISAQGNSGIMFHVTEEFNEPYESGPEYQILDDTGYPGEVKDVHLTGANYDMQATTNTSVNPVEEWNTGKIIVNNKVVEHWLNGEKILTYELGSAEWQKRKLESKWKDFPGYGMAGKGHIDLQDHGNEVWFRNLFIKPL